MPNVHFVSRVGARDSGHPAPGPNRCSPPSIAVCVARLGQVSLLQERPKTEGTAAIVKTRDQETPQHCANPIVIVHATVP